MAALEGASPRPEKRADIAKKIAAKQLAVRLIPRRFFFTLPWWGKVKRSSIIARILYRPRVGRVPVPAPRNVEGMARQAARRSHVITYRFRHVAPLGAPSRRSHIGAGAALSAPTPGVPVGVLAPVRLIGLSRRHTSRPAEPTTVSELLAGDRSVPGRSPAPPGRGRSVRLPRAGATSGPTVMTPHEAPSVDRTIRTIYL